MGEAVEIFKFLWIPVMGVFSYFYVNSEKAKKQDVDDLKVDLDKAEKEIIDQGKDIAVLQSKQLSRIDVEKIIADKVGPIDRQLQELKEEQRNSSNRILESQKQVMDLIMKNGDRRNSE